MCGFSSGRFEPPALVHYILMDKLAEFAAVAALPVECIKKVLRAAVTLSVKFDTGKGDGVFDAYLVAEFVASLGGIALASVRYHGISPPSDSEIDQFELMLQAGTDAILECGGKGAPSTISLNKDD